ncbi:thiamine pyrophosphate-dependent enzyme [Candidatus Leptofilum sp.]|uniref:thiamine pyrophosphate-dependent enzyme n=1 Tax=Candidatus Leptofilum sp. TaxID=3241576 RepID=UPI003B5909A7
MTIPLTLTRKDFVSDQTVRWCPGCGDYAILASVQKTLPEIGVPKENIVFISGIGCSSRFPYYMNTYGIHSIHGRAPTLATGLAISNPELSVWVITGDGDGLSIGGNHLIHAIRRNVNLNILLFNNRIYGLTKGQYSPTSRQGHKTKSSPMGSLEQPLNPIALAMAAESTFIARSIDAHTQHLGEVLYEASQHKGVSFVEIYQNCVIFNPTEWEGLDDRRVRDENILYLEHGKPMIYGKDHDKGIRLNGFRPEVVQLGNGITEDDLLVHDETSTQLAFILSSMEYPEFPAPMGVIRRVEKQTYGEGLMGQIASAQEAKGKGDLRTLYESADLWTVTAKEKPKTKQTGRLSLEVDEAYVDDIDKEPEPTTDIQDRLIEDTLATLNPKRPITIDASASLAKAVHQMNGHRIGCLLVTNAQDKLVGIFTEKDVLHRVVGLVDDMDTAVLADYMTPDPIALMSDLPIAQALHEMHVHGFRHLPLVDEEHRPEGIISFRDVVRHLKELLA